MAPGPGRLVIPPVSAAAPGALYEQIVAGITREVSEGRLAPGTALPSFRGLAEELLVSVITVKRAYDELERAGIIYRRQGLGTFVAAAAADRSRAAQTERTRELLREAVREGSEAGLRERDLTRLFHDAIAERGGTVHVRKRG
jgi:GntR family transcriptional regulator